MSCLVLLVEALWAIGCSTPRYHTSGPAGSLDGTVPPFSEPFPPLDAVYRPSLVGAWPGGVQMLVTDYAWACETEALSRKIAGSRAMSFELGGVPPVAAGTTENVPLGTYAISRAGPAGPFSARAWYRLLDGSCQGPNSMSEALEGSLTMESYDAGGPLSASFEVYFSGGAHLAGQFRATRCLWLARDWTGNAACGPPVQCTPTAGGNDAGDVPVHLCH